MKALDCGFLLRQLWGSPTRPPPAPVPGTSAANSRRPGTASDGPATSPAPGVRRQAHPPGPVHGRHGPVGAPQTGHATAPPQLVV